MSVPEQCLLSDLLHHRVLCDQGIDHGLGNTAWMHLPCHRLLGWSSRPSSLKLSRHVWRLNQLRGIGSQKVFVKGDPSVTDQQTLDRLPSLIDADLLNKNGERIASIVDFVFEPRTGNIVHYLVSRSDPRLPGTSRWCFTIDKIKDQQPGMVSSDLLSIDDLPLVKASVRQDLLRRSKNWREQLQEISNKATNRLEGWLEDPPWDDSIDHYDDSEQLIENDPLDDWDDYFEEGSTDSLSDSKKTSFRFSRDQEREDPWI